MNSSEKLIALLKILSLPPYEHGVTELGEKIECGKSGTFKLLSVLLKNGFATQNSNSKYSLGISTYLIGRTYEEYVGITNFIKPYLVELRDLINENVNLGMIVDGKATIICRVESNQLLRISGSIGATRPFYTSAMGKVLAAFEESKTIAKRLASEPVQSFTDKTITSPDKILAELAKIRETGYAISDEEYAHEAFGIGAPILDSQGKVLAAISIGVPKTRIDGEKTEQYIALLLKTASKVHDGLCFSDISTPATSKIEQLKT